MKRHCASKIGRLLAACVAKLHFHFLRSKIILGHHALNSVLMQCMMKQHRTACVSKRGQSREFVEKQNSFRGNYIPVSPKWAQIDTLAGVFIIKTLLLPLRFASACVHKLSCTHFRSHKAEQASFISASQKKGGDTGM